MNDVESLIRRTAKIQYKVNANDKKPRTFGTRHKLYQSEIHFIEAIGLDGGYSASELSEKLGITNGAVTQVADKLLKKKLIEKYKKADNKKTVYFKLTKEGTVAYNNHEKFHAGFNEKLAAYLSSLSKKEFDAIARLAELVDNNIPDLSTQEGFILSGIITPLKNTGEFANRKHRILYVRYRVQIKQLPKLIFCSAVQF